ncbi:MAG: ABC transporter substrate-binding protein [Elainellaceae cyanobacterium]
MRWGWFLGVITSSLLVVVGVSMLTHNHYQRNVLTVATSADYCPYEFVSITEGQRTLEGFDIDVMEAIATRLGTTVQFEEMPFSGIFPKLQTDKTDVAIAAITPTDERRRVSQFSKIYYEAQSTVVSRQDFRVDEPVNLKDRLIGVKPGTVHELWVKTQTEKEIVPFQKAREGLRKLRLRRLDAVVMDQTVAEKYGISQTDFCTLTLPNEEPAGVAIAFPRSSKLVGQVNRILDELESDGTLSELVVKWFDDYTCELETT